MVEGERRGGATRKYKSGDRGHQGRWAGSEGLCPDEESSSAPSTPHAPSQHCSGSAAAVAFSFTGNLGRTWSNYQPRGSGSTFRMC